MPRHDVTVTGKREPEMQNWVIALFRDKLEYRFCGDPSGGDNTRALKQAMMQELLTGRTRLVARGGAENAEVKP